LTGSGRELPSEKCGNLYCATKYCWGDDVGQEEIDLHVIVHGEMRNAYWIFIGNLRKREKLEVWHNIKMDVTRRACEEMGGPCGH
jgi:hypothetical protein